MDQDFILYSIQAEQSVLGGLLLDNNQFQAVNDLLKVSDFYERKHQIIFTAIAQLEARHEVFDALTLSDALRSKGQLAEIGNEISLYELVKNTPSAANILAYADIVKEYAEKRELLALWQHDISKNYNRLSIKEITEKLENKIFDLIAKNLADEGMVGVKRDFKQLICNLDDQFHGEIIEKIISTGYKELDAIFSGGFRPGELITIGASTGQGKTTFALNMAVNVAAKHEDVLIFSLEMTRQSLVRRLTAMIGEINAAELRSGQAMDSEKISKKLDEAQKFFEQDKIFIKDKRLRLYKIKSILKQWMVHHQRKIGLVIIDYLQLIRISKYRNGNVNSRYQEVSEISNVLKEIALDLKVPIIAIAQLNREVKNQVNQTPLMSNFRDSGSIEQDSDIVMMLHYPQQEDKSTVQVSVLKNRDGENGEVKFHFNRKYLKFNAIAKNFNEYR